MRNVISIIILSMTFDVLQTESFLVGACIGPKDALERFLDKNERSTLRSIVHDNFNGKNAVHVMQFVLTFVRSRLTDKEWESIQLEIRAHEARKPECSMYAQLLPPALYRRLLKRVWDASEKGADQKEMRSIIEEFIEDLVMKGELRRSLNGQDEPFDDNANNISKRHLRRVQYPELIQYPGPIIPYPNDHRPWYTGSNEHNREDTVEWQEENRVRNQIKARKNVGSAFMPLPPALPINRMSHPINTHRPPVRQSRPIFPTLIPSFKIEVDREEEELNTENDSPVFERFSFGARHDSEPEKTIEFPSIVGPLKPLPIPISKMPRVRVGDGRYMRPPLTLKVARELATKSPRVGGTLETYPPPLPLPSIRRRRPSILSSSSSHLTFPRIQLIPPPSPSPSSFHSRPILMDLSNER